MIEFTEEVFDGALMRKFLNGTIVWKKRDEEQYYLSFDNRPEDFRYNNIEDVGLLQPINAETKAEVDRLNALQAVHNNALEIIYQKGDKVVVVSPERPGNPCIMTLELFNSLTEEEITAFNEPDEEREVDNPLCVIREDVGLVIW